MPGIAMSVEDGAAQITLRMNGCAACVPTVYRASSIPRYKHRYSPANMASSAASERSDFRYCQEHLLTKDSPTSSWTSQIQRPNYEDIALGKENSEKFPQ
jgi:hypothetical protein